MKVQAILNHLTELSQAQRKAAVGVEHDQFFTRPPIAAHFAQWVKSHDFFKNVTKMIEPAAGNKDLAKYFPGIEMYDLDPQSDDINQQDFFASQHKYQPGFLVVMNPPFGKRSNLAIQFFNKSAEFADYIAQIVPRTFRRPSVQDQMSTKFELLDEYVLPNGSFYLPAEGPDRKFTVPAVAQIWHRVEQRNPRQEVQKSTRYTFVQNPADADFAFRRKGNAGEVVTQNIEQTNPNSFFYIKANDPNVIRDFKAVDWSKYGNDVMAARSISQKEIAQAVQ